MFFQEMFLDESNIKRCFCFSSKNYYLLSGPKIAGNRFHEDTRIDVYVVQPEGKGQFVKLNQNLMQIKASFFGGEIRS